MNHNITESTRSRNCVDGRKCSYTGCKKSRRYNPELSFFRFPPKEDDRFHAWCTNCRRPEFAELGNKTLVQKYICSDHFPDWVFTNELKKKFNRNAKAIPLPPVQCEKEIPGDSSCTSRVSNIEETLQVILLEGESALGSGLLSDDRSLSSFSDLVSDSPEMKVKSTEENCEATPNNTSGKEGTSAGSVMSHDPSPGVTSSCICLPFPHPNTAKEVVEDPAPKRTRTGFKSQDIPTYHRSTHNGMEDHQHKKMGKECKNSIHLAAERIGIAQEASRNGISRIAEAIDERNTIEKERNVMLRELFSFLTGKSDL